MNTILKLWCCVVVTAQLFCFSCGTSGKKYLNAAEEASAWISSTGVIQNDRVFFPSQPDTMKRGEISLYYGVPGPVLFYLELYKATGKEQYKRQALSAANWLIEQAHSDSAGYYWTDVTIRGTPYPDPGLYTGTAGVGTAFLELGKMFNDSLHWKYARGAADWLTAHKIKEKQGADWNGSNDIISGAAGTGLFLIRASKILGNPAYLETAKDAGDFLISRSISDPPGVKWGASADTSRLYPNFSHGTSGIAYFLAVLYQATHEERYLKAAVEGANWLIAHKEVSAGEGDAWYHHEPDGKNLYYVGWCHGPAGTGRLFYQLFLVTGDSTYFSILKETARWLITCGIPDKLLPGFWNVSVCCGNAGIADFFADMYRLTGNKLYRDWAVKIADDLLNKASPSKPGLKWIQAENRTRPNEVYAQTGYSQGAAGIGILLLKMYAYSYDIPPFIPLTLPDSPFFIEK